MKTEIVRVLRILEYVGTREFVENTLQKSAVPINGKHICGSGNMIKSAIIDGFPEILDSERVGKDED